MRTAAARFLITDPIEDYLNAQIAALTSSWDELTSRVEVAPHLDWEDWKETLLALTETPSQELLVRGALAALIKTADQTHPILVLQHLLVLAIRAADPHFTFPSGTLSSPTQEEDDMP